MILLLTATLSTLTEGCIVTSLPCRIPQHQNTSVQTENHVIFSTKHISVQLHANTFLHNKMLKQKNLCNINSKCIKIQYSLYIMNTFSGVTSNISVAYLVVTKSLYLSEQRAQASSSSSSSYVEGRHDNRQVLPAVFVLSTLLSSLSFALVHSLSSIQLLGNFRSPELCFSGTVAPIMCQLQLSELVQVV